MKYFKRKFQKKFARRFRPRTFRRVPRIGTRRFFKYIRKNPKPEIKFINTFSATQTIPPQNAYTVAIAPITIPQGNNQNTRIGSEITSRKMNFRWSIVGVSSSSIDANADGVCRMILWTPKRPFTECQDYITAINALQGNGTLQQIDWNIMHVVKDQYINYGLHDPSSANADQNVYPNNIIRSWTVNHIRRMDFGSTTTGAQVDANRCQLYCTIFMPTLGPGIQFYWSSKLTFTDV